MKGVPLELTRETCTACAGSMILEMAALSRLTGDSIFEVYYIWSLINLLFIKIKFYIII